MDVGCSDSPCQFLPPWQATYIASSSRLQTPSLSKVLRRWFLMTCSVVPKSLPISRLVRPSHTRVATCSSLGVKRSRGNIFHLRFLECGGSQPHPLTPFPNSSAQKKRAQMLFHGARADAQLPGDFLIAAALDQ